MADITVNELREFIALKLPSESEIPAIDHRAVENKIVDYVEQELGKVVKSKSLYLDVFTTNRNYSVSTGLPASSVIDDVAVMLECKTSNNGFGVGEVVTAPTPYPADGGRTSAQGIGVQFSKIDSSTIRIVVNHQITIMTAYVSTINAGAGNVLIWDSLTANWKIKIIVTYK
ncbi:hypothetical protein [uncultured Flavobacterium sp.]|uniref:hypothetical protein n=1 Tax=uncultured Flavobacterium sp. TaxID=165435 RepID=UPI0025FA3E68|nr:hypothetical protein [uncultured Flavobacterium sp.]